MYKLTIRIISINHKLLKIQHLNFIKCCKKSYLKKKHKNRWTKSFLELDSRLISHRDFYMNQNFDKIMLDKTNIVTLDLEGVLTPEVWISVAEKTGIEDLKLTTRDISDYDELMTHRLSIIKKHGIKIKTIQAIISTLKLLPGALNFLSWLRTKTQVVILSDTFYEFADFFMQKLNYPTLLCHSLIINDGIITGYKLRINDAKTKAVNSFKQLGFYVIAAGDSYNDTGMLSVADKGILFNAPQNVIDEFPKFTVCKEYSDFKQTFINLGI